MSRDDTFATGALLVGSGLAGYGVWRWLQPRRAEAARAPASARTLPSSSAVAVAAEAVASVAPTAASVPEEVIVSGTSVAPPSETSDGPVSSPSQVEAPTSPTGLSREFDPVFERYRGSIPLEYLRALAKRESGMRPGEHRGPAWGLMQIVEVVRHDFNKAHATHYTRRDLLDPAVSVAMCCWVLRFIIDSYQRHHPRVANLREDWSNPRFVQLLTAGWNMGFSEKAGVGKVVGYLEGLGADDIDLDMVHDHARLAGASKHVGSDAKLRWCKSVVTLFEAELAPRNAARRRRAGRRGASAAKHGMFILRTYPEGMWGPVITRWYRAAPATTWEDAKRRLIVAGVLDVRVLRPTEWKLVGDPPFRVPQDRVRLLPGGVR